MRSNRVNLQRPNPGLLNAPPNADPLTGHWQNQMTTSMRQGLGQSGDPAAKFVTWHDLEDNGFAKSSGPLGSGGSGGTGEGHGGWEPVGPPEEPLDFSPPPPLENFEASGGFTAIYTTWDNPKLVYYYHIEIHRSATDDLGTAALIGTTMANIYADQVGSDTTLFYYWARIVKEVGGENVLGAWNATEGTPAQAAEDPEWILAQIEGMIDETHLNDELSEEIGRIDTIAVDVDELETGLSNETKARQEEDESLSLRIDANVSRIDDNQASIVEESGTRATEDEALAGQITTLQAEVDDNRAAIQTESTVRATEDEALAEQINTVQVELDDVSGSVETNSSAIATVEDDVTEIRTEYTVKLDSDGYVGGFGLVNEDETITALWRVDVFGVGAPGSEELTFAIDTEQDRVVMSGAYIQDATITDAQIGDLSVDKLTGDTANFVEVNIADGSITNAHIGNYIQSDNYVAGSTGWHLNKEGYFECKNINARGLIEGSVIEGSLIDGSLFIDPETETVVPTEADTGTYPRYLTYSNNYSYSNAITAYDGRDERTGDDYWVRTVKSPILSCPIHSASYTGAGNNGIIYHDQERFEKHNPYIYIHSNEGSSYEHDWCQGTCAYDDENRQMNQMRIYCTIFNPGREDLHLYFEATLNIWNCEGNDGHAWPQSMSALTQVNKGFTLTFRYICPPGPNGSCHGRNTPYFYFHIGGYLPDKFGLNDKVTAQFYFEWRSVYNTDNLTRNSYFKKVVIGGETRR